MGTFFDVPVYFLDHNKNRTLDRNHGVPCIKFFVYSDKYQIRNLDDIHTVDGEWADALLDTGADWYYADSDLIRRRSLSLVPGAPRIKANNKYHWELYRGNIMIPQAQISVNSDFIEHDFSAQKAAHSVILGRQFLNDHCVFHLGGPTKVTTLQFYNPGK